MGDNLQYELCPETGIGCLIMGKDGESYRFDLMPDEAVELHHIVETGDIEAARELLAGIVPESAETLEKVGIEELSREIG